MKKKVKLTRYCTVRTRINYETGEVQAIVEMDDRESVPATLLNTFGANVRLKLTWEECDVEPTKGDHVRYRVEILPWATRMMNEAGNTYDQSEVHEILKKAYWKVRRGEPTPSLADIGRAEMKKYMEWIEDNVSEFYGGKPPTNRNVPNPC